MEDHDYEVIHQHLIDHGYQPTTDMKGVLREMFEDLIPLRERIESVQDRFIPEVRWTGESRKSEAIK